jgi:dihydrofolate synthase / folylpolyglutamate synthase
MTNSGISYLDSLTGYESTGAVAAPSIAAMKRLVEQMSSPQAAYPCVHVTGTNGKGSTSTMTAGLLRAAGLNVGLYTSPHLRHMGERISVNGVPSTDADLGQALAAVRDAADALGMVPSWFEAITAAGFRIFADAGVDVAVIEVGMLGRWDATNVIDADVAVVTNVELDHVEFAGASRAAIAREKAGIITPGATLILGETDLALRPILDARRPGAVLSLGDGLRYRRRFAPAAGHTMLDVQVGAGPWQTLRPPMDGEHQYINATLALAAAEARLGRRLTPAEVQDGMAASRLPGRLQIVSRAPLIIADVAHNPAAATAVRAAIDRQYPQRSALTLLCGVLRGRDPITFLRALGAQEADRVVVTTPSSPRAMPAAELADAARQLGIAVAAEPDPSRALAAAVSSSQPEDLILVTGSHYLIGPILDTVQLPPDEITVA